MAEHSRSSLDTRESLDEEVRRLAEYKQTSVSLKATLDTGLGLIVEGQDLRAVRLELVPDERALDGAWRLPLEAELGDARVAVLLERR